MRRLVLFARCPHPGRVKSRLAPSVGREVALALYRAFLSDQLRLLERFRSSCRLELCADGPWPSDPELAPRIASLAVTLQCSGDLGRRLLHCLRRAWRDGSRATVVVGADAPTLPDELVREAFRSLERGTPAVVVPSADGGYVLLGVVRPLPELFHDLPWGSSRLLEATIDRARSRGIELHRLDAWYDVDVVDDLQRLRADLRSPAGRARAPATARALAATGLGDSTARGRP